MYITNPKQISTLKTFSCGELLGRWLYYDMNIPVLSIKKAKNTNEPDEYVFSNTDLLKEVLKKMPLWLKIFSKIIY